MKNFVVAIKFTTLVFSSFLPKGILTTGFFYTRGYLFATYLDYTQVFVCHFIQCIFKEILKNIDKGRFLNLNISSEKIILA